MKPYKINYLNGTADSIEYTIDGIKYKKDILSLLCDFVNDIDVLHEIYLLEEKDTSLYTELQNNFSDYLKRANLSMNDYLAQNCYNYNKLCSVLSPDSLISGDWYSSPDAISFADKIKREIFFKEANVLYSINEHSLIFLNKYINSLDELKDTPISPLYVFYSPSQYSICMHFLTLQRELRRILIEKKKKNEHLSLIQKLYIQSDEFVNYHLLGILKKYLPEVIIQNQFQSSGNDLSTLIEDFPRTLKRNNNILTRESIYKLEKLDFYHSYITEHPADYIKYIKKNSDMPDKIINDKDITSSLSEIMDFFHRHFYMPEKNGYLSSYKYSDNCFIIDYMDFNTHKIRSISIEIPDKHLKLLNFISKTMLDKTKESGLPVELSVCFATPDGGNLLLPLSSDVDMISYFNDINRHYRYNLYKDVINFYNQRKDASKEYIRTGSLGTIILTLNDAFKNEEINSICRCKECKKFFISHSSYEKYCDAGRGNLIADKTLCSYKAKRKSQRELDIALKSLQNKRRNIQKKVNYQSDYYITKKDTYEDWNCKMPKPSLNAKNNISDEYIKFLLHIRQLILLDLYDVEKKYISNQIKKLQYGDEKGMIIDYGFSFFPGYSSYNLFLPRKDNTEDFFFGATDGFEETFQSLLAEHTIKFDWAIWMSRIAKPTPAYDNTRLSIMHDVYLSFKKWLNKNKFKDNINNLNKEIKDSLTYITSFK